MIKWRQMEIFNCLIWFRGIFYILLPEFFKKISPLFSRGPYIDQMVLSVSEHGRLKVLDLSKHMITHMNRELTSDAAEAEVINLDQNSISKLENISHLRNLQQVRTIQSEIIQQYPAVYQNKFCAEWLFQMTNLLSPLWYFLISFQKYFTGEYDSYISLTKLHDLFPL